MWTPGDTLSGSRFGPADPLVKDADIVYTVNTMYTRPALAHTHTITYSVAGSRQPYSYNHAANFSYQSHVLACVFDRTFRSTFAATDAVRTATNPSTRICIGPDAGRQITRTPAQPAALADLCDRRGAELIAEGLCDASDVPK